MISMCPTLAFDVPEQRSMCPAFSMCPTFHVPDSMFPTLIRRFLPDGAHTYWRFPEGSQGPCALYIPDRADDDLEVSMCPGFYGRALGRADGLTSAPHGTVIVRQDGAR